MKIKSLKIQGFRGFNEERTLDFHPGLTLIFAPNSYGKTSISEALEWLFYGVTSKVENADSKDEYKGSYRNRHLPVTHIPFVQVRLLEDGTEITLKGELNDDDTINRFFGEKESLEQVEEWPLGYDLLSFPRPFILQHALKYLLLTKPDDRFQGFARLLGLEALDEIQSNVISLCTAPERKIPREVKELQTFVSLLEDRLATRPSLASLHKLFKKKNSNFADIEEALIIEGRKWVPGGTEDDAIFPQLLKIREEAVGKVFKGHLTLPDYSSLEKQQNSEDENLFLRVLTETFIKEYLDLIQLANLEHLLKQSKFIGLGIELLHEAAGLWPLCGQLLDDSGNLHIVEMHTDLVEKAKFGEELEEQRVKVKELCKKFKSQLQAYQNRHLTKSKSLLDISNSLEELKPIFIPKYERYFPELTAIVLNLSKLKEKFESSYEVVLNNLSSFVSSVEKSTEQSALVQVLGESLLCYISEVHKYAEYISQKSTVISEADQILQFELDILAGTEDISLLIDLFNQRSAIKKKLRIDSIIASLKDLRKTTDTFVATRMLSAISGDLTSEVMEWYKKIKTTGDPDVHFDGFDMERTRKGEVKARRVSIKAKSYGEELVSAVSSLSESKLNALGLCVSIATNLRAQSPFEFLIIDDPIQSLDNEHEAQFIDVIRALVEKNHKQVIVLSHNRKWLEEVCAGCRSLNGWFYEVTGYSQKGPHISSVAWEKWQERLKVVDAILKNPDAGLVHLQQAEEEIRIVVSELTTNIYKIKKGITKSPHSLNADQVEKMLIECGVEMNLVNKTKQTFRTTDDSHHAPADYCPSRDRIRLYHSWVHDLAKILRNN